MTRNYLLIAFVTSCTAMHGLGLRAEDKDSATEKPQGAAEKPAAGLIRSARSGPWSAAATWEGGQVPGAGARVQVREGHTVVYDVKSEQSMRLVHVAGTLAFDREKDTRLVVGLIKIQPGDDASEDGFDCDAHLPDGPASGPRPALEVGTPERPIEANHTAVIRLVDCDGVDKNSWPAIACCGVLLENMRIHKCRYGIYHSNFDRHVYREKLPHVTRMLSQQQKESAAPLEQDALLKKLATPGEHHQRFDALAGKWNLAVKWRNTPDAKWTESKGVAEYKWILGGRFLREEFKYDMGGEPLEWMGIYGYDNFQKKFTAVWVDNMGTNTEFAEGQYDSKGKVFSYIGEQDDPATGGNRKFKWMITVESQDRVRFDSFDQDPPGTYFKNTEVVGTRFRESR